MDLSRVLLVLLYMAASEVQDIQTRPIDFVCNDQARRSMNTVKEMQSAMGACDGSSLLHSAIPLPCVRINMGVWRRKSLQEKKGQVLAALKTLAEGLQRVGAQNYSGCQAKLLERLEHSVDNHLRIVTKLEVPQDEGETQDPTCPSQDTLYLKDVLTQYYNLLKGMLELFVHELKGRCQEET
ncbi:hypothetical protein GJAV_G00055690 [Gymnothorax javanicus]|nr:hypothetical protein GJAV_G00055690 [Gymnothorax javanicus]